MLLPSLALADVTIPAQGAWTDHGTILNATGIVGDWNREFAGVAPCDVVLSGGTLYLYYIGSDGDRQFDSGPRHRRLGLATCPTSSDCTNSANWTEDPGNPILDHRPNLDVPDDEWGEEEGVWTCSVLDEGDGNFRLYFGAMTNAGNAQSVEDEGKVVSSTDLTSWPDGVAASTKVLDNDCPGLWGCGDELDHLTVFKVGSTYHTIYQVGTGTSPSVSWGLGYVTGTTFDTVDTGTSAEWLDFNPSPAYRGNCNDVRISTTHRAVFCDAWSNPDFNDGIEAYRIADSAPGTPGAIQEAYDFTPATGESTVFMDEAAGLWYLFYRDRSFDQPWGLGSTIRVKTAPVVGETGLLPGSDGTQGGGGGSIASPRIISMAEAP